MKPKLSAKKPSRIKDLIFIKSLELAKSNPNKIGLMLLFDILFLVSTFVLQILFGYFAKSLIVPQTLASAFIFIIFSLIYYLIIIFVYSFFKYSILGFIKSFFEKSEFSFNRLGQFYSVNIVIAGIFFSIMILFSFILASIKQTYAPFVFIFLAAPYLLFLYIVTNISHSLFYQGASIKESIKKTFESVFTKIKIYREIILVMILTALFLWLLFFGSGYLIRLIASKNYNLYINLYKYFKYASIIIFDVVVYCIILINRISFYQIIRNFNFVRQN